MVGALMLRHDLLQKGLLEGAAPAAVERRVKDGVGQALDALERGFATGRGLSSFEVELTGR